MIQFDTTGELLRTWLNFREVGDTLAAVENGGFAMSGFSSASAQDNVMVVTATIDATKDADDETGIDAEIEAGFGMSAADIRAALADAPGRAGLFAHTP